MAHDMYVYSDKGTEPVVYRGQEWMETGIVGVQVWVSPDNQWCKVRQTMQWEDMRGVWPVSQQKMNGLARTWIGDSKCHQDTLSGMSIHTVWTRTYRVK